MNEFYQTLHLHPKETQESGKVLFGEGNICLKNEWDFLSLFLILHALLQKLI